MTIHINRNRCAYVIELLYRIQRNLYIFIIIILASCATIPKQIYINKASFPGISNAAVIVSVSKPGVTHSLNNPFLGDPISSWFAGYGYWNAALFMSMAYDSESGNKIEEHVNINSIEEYIANTFIQPLRKGNYFHTIEYIQGNNQDIFKLSSAGYNKIIRLSVTEMSFRTATTDHVKLYITMHGQMQDLISKNIIWDREEKVSSSEMELLKNIEVNGPKHLTATIEKAVRYLANDFIYIK